MWQNTRCSGGEGNQLLPSVINFIQFGERKIFSPPPQVEEWTRLRAMAHIAACRRLEAALLPCDYIPIHKIQGDVAESCMIGFI